MVAPVTIEPVTARRQRRAFRDLPHRLYLEDPHWVPPLHRDIDGFLDVRRHPFYAAASAEFFLARRGATVVGRIAAIENRAHNLLHGDRVGFFGFFESERDSEVARALLQAAETWLRERGLDRARGPISPSLNYESGLLISGEPGPPYVLMPHNPPFYAGLLEDAGYGKAMDLHAYFMDGRTIDSERWARRGEALRRRAGVTVRLIDFSNFAADVRLLIDIYHDAWSENWGFVPLNDGEVERMAKELKPLLLPFMGAFLVKDGREIAFWLGLLDFNQVLIRLGGRLFPTGLFRILAAKKRIRHLRILLMGVRKAFQGRGLDALLYDHSVQECVPRGIDQCEASWILDSNHAMINAMERVGGRRFRTYRVFEKSLSAIP